MKSFSAIWCALVLFVVLNVASAKEMCTPMDPKEKAVYEKVYGTDFMGCTLSSGEGMTALSRVHWLTPVGGHPLVEMEPSATSEMEGISKMKGGAMMMAGVKVAGSSIGRPGYLTASPECVASLEPDFVYSLLAKSSSPKVFNAALEEACEEDSVRTLKNSVRLDDDTQALAEAAVCIIGSVLGLIFPVFTPALVDALKAIVSDVFPILPCPSDVARMVETVGHA